jgi:UDP-glucose 4-epimerase
MNLVTGSSGFIGSHLKKALPNAWGVDRVVGEDTDNFEQIDLLNKNDLFWFMKSKGFENVFHNAAVPSVPYSYEEPMKSYQNNVTASINLIEVCRSLGAKIIFASSSSVNGPSPYGHSKKIIEDMLPKCGVRYTTLRYFNVFGKGQRSNVASIMLDAIVNNKQLTINGDGHSTVRDFTYVDNVVLANKKAVSKEYDGQLLEAGTGQPHSLLDLYNTIKEILRSSHDNVVFGPKRHGDIDYSCANTFLEVNELIEFKDGVRAWLQKENLL